MAQILLNNRFSILHLENTSNFSKVLFALDTYQNPPRNCVIKIYKPISQKTQIKQWIAKEFQKEANRLKQISLAEPSLPEIYTYSYNSQGYYLVRELIEGLTLRKQVQTKGTFSSKSVRSILSKLLFTLDHLHQKKIIHQNIRPKNIILRHSDNAPISINFGSIKQIVATFDFHEHKNIFSLKDVHGYTASEQALGKSIPASDIYSLGLTAVYLLTGKDPKEIPIDIDSGQYKIPVKISNQDKKLADIILRATNLNPENRYSSAKEMIDALFDDSRELAIERPIMKYDNSFSHQLSSINEATDFNQNDKKEKLENQKTNRWLIILLILIGSISLANLYLVLKFRANASKTNPILENPISTDNLAEEPEVFTKKGSILNDKLKNALEIPIFVTGSPKKELRKALGEPNAIKKGYWKNSSAWIYKKQGNGLIDLGYLFDLDTGKLKQTEIAIADSVDLITINEILDSLLQGGLNQDIAQGLKQVHEGQIETYSFKLKNLKGSIEIEEDGNIYLGIWEKDFH